jgi:microcin C transport system permease protein
MLNYIVRRLLLMIPTIFGVLTLTFVIAQFVPGGPVEQVISQMRHRSASGAMGHDLNPAQIEAIKKQFGFDKPPLTRYLMMLRDYSQFKLGRSFTYSDDVWKVIVSKLPVSISLGLWSTLLGYLLSIPLGIAKAVREGTRFDTATTMLVLVGYAIPGFVLGVLLIILFCGGSFLDWFPLRGLVSDNWEDYSFGRRVLDYFWHLTLPLICLTIGNFATLTMLTKNTFIEEIRKQYVLVARAKGLSERKILYKHIFRNALLPLVTGLPGAIVAAFFSGALLVETLFIRLDHASRLSGGARKHLPVHPDRAVHQAVFGSTLRRCRSSRAVREGRAMTVDSAVVVAMPSAVAPAVSRRSPWQRAWARFKRNRVGYISFWIFGVLLTLATIAPLISNEKPLLAYYEGKLYVPILFDYPETTFGGDFLTPVDWFDPFVDAQFGKPGNWRLHTLNRYSANTINYTRLVANPAPPSAINWAGTDPHGRDVLARLLYGFAVSVYFGLALTIVGTLLGIVAGAVQGYFGGWVDLSGQRLIDIWNAIPILYILIILASMFEPSILLLVVLFAIFGWTQLSDYVRAEFLRNRSLEFVKAARAMGLSHWRIIRRHILPNSMTPVITFLPFRMSEAILGLTALDFLGLGVPATVPSLGELLRFGKDNLDAWWITIPTFLVLVTTLLLLTFVGDALRDAFDTRKA